MYDIEIYEDKNGKSEIKEYIKKLSDKKSLNKDYKIRFTKIISYIDLLSRNGLQLTAPYIKKIDKEIWELRPLRERILFASLYNNKFVLLSVFMKQSQKTPKREIDKANRLLEDYKKRRGKNE